MSEPKPDIIRAVLLDPQWEWGVLEFDGARHIFLRLLHPEHGPIHSLVPCDVAEKMADGLKAALDRRPVVRLEQKP